MARGANPCLALTVHEICPCGSDVATYTSSANGAAPGGFAGMKCRFGAVSVICSNPFTLYTAAVPIWYSVYCTLGEYTPPRGGPKKFSARASYTPS